MTDFEGGRSLQGLCACALFSALLCILSPFALPLGPIPLSLGLFAVLLLSATLPPHRALISVALFLFLGACGLPVFSGGNGGFAVLIGPTGGYLWSYLLVAFAVGALSRGHGSRVRGFLACLAGVGVCYLCGAVQYWLITQSALSAVLLTAVLPFLPFDLLKALLAARIAVRLRAHLRSIGL